MVKKAINSIYAIVYALFSDNNSILTEFDPNTDVERIISRTILINKLIKMVKILQSNSGAKLL